MTPAQTRSEIDRLTTLLYGAKLAIDSNPAILVRLPGGNIITWSNEVELSSIINLSSTYDIYLESLRKRYFSIVLFDGSLLQISYTFRGNDLVKHRLCFMPCPIQVKDSDLGFVGLEELVELLDNNEFKDRVRLEGPLRFDYDKDAGTLHHPPSHFTISRTSCRVPVSAPLSIGHFVNFLFGNFYEKQWCESEDLRNWSCTSLDNCLPDLEKDRLYVHWRR